MGGLGGPVREFGGGSGGGDLGGQAARGGLLAPHGGDGRRWVGRLE